MARKNPSLVIVGNPREHMSGEVQYIGYRHVADGQNYQHDFGPGVEMTAESDGAVTLAHPAREVWKDFDGQTFLVNPPKRRKSTMARRLPPRHRSGPKKGQFKKRARSKTRRRNQPRQYASRPRARPRKAAAAPRARVYRPRPRKRAAVARRPRRQNQPRLPTMRKIFRDIQDGAMNAGWILVGKATARTIVQLTPGLPRAGMQGLAVQALSAVAAGLLADWLLGSSQAKFVLAGGFTAPIETLVVAYNVPFLAPALSPIAAANDLQGYRGVGSYVEPVMSNGIGRYVAAGAGLSGYVSASEAMNGTAGWSDDY